MLVHVMRTRGVCCFHCDRILATEYTRVQIAVLSGQLYISAGALTLPRRHSKKFGTPASVNMAFDPLYPNWDTHIKMAKTA